MVSGLIFFILGVSLCIASMKLKFGYFHKPGPGFMPFLSGAFLGLLGLMLTFSSFLKRVSQEGELNRKKNSVNWKRVLIYISAIFAYALVLNSLGFLITTFIFLIVLFKLAEPKRFMVPIVLSLSSVILSYLLFWVWLRCPLPRGILSF